MLIATLPKADDFGFVKTLVCSSLSRRNHPNSEFFRGSARVSCVSFLRRTYDGKRSAMDLEFAYLWRTDFSGE